MKLLPFLLGLLLLCTAKAEAQLASPQSSGYATNAPTSNPTPDLTPTPTPTPNTLGFGNVKPYFEVYGNLRNPNAFCIGMYPAKDGCSMRSFPGYIKWDGSQGLIIFCNTPVELLPPVWYFGFSGCGSEIDAMSAAAYSKIAPFANDSVLADRASSNSLVLENREARSSQKVSLRKLIEFFQSLFPSRAARETTTDAAQEAGTNPGVRQTIQGNEQGARVIRETAEQLASSPVVDKQTQKLRIVRDMALSAKAIELDAIDRYNDAVLREVEKWRAEGEDVSEIIHDLLSDSPDTITRSLPLSTETGVLEKSFMGIPVRHPSDPSKDRLFLLFPWVDYTPPK